MCFDNAPAEMQALRQWVTYGTGKIPYTPGSSARASSKSPASWGSFERACDDVSAGRRAGIGFEFAQGGGIVGVDFDHCLKDGQADPWTAAWIKRFGSYTEVSPSGTGLHIFCLGELPGKGVKRSQAEMYDRGRYFTVTGDSFGPVLPLRSVQEVIDDLYAELATKAVADTPTMERKPVALSDDEIIQKAMTAHNGDTFSALWKGDISGYPSQSEADVAFCNIMAFWTNGDPERVDAIYRRSGLMREKWDRPTGGSTYGAITIMNAVNTMTSGYDLEEYRNQTAKEDFTDPRKLKITRMADISPQRAEYLWFPYLPRGKLTIIAGVSGSTKTWECCDIAARVSKGESFITDDELTKKRQPGIAIYQTKENDFASDLRFRFDKLAANLNNIVTIDDRNTDGHGFPLTLTDGRLEEAASQLQPDLIIFDPIQSYIGAEVDFHKANEVRPILDKLIDLAKRFNCAVVLVAHMSKMTTASALDRILGSSDFRNAARSILIIGSDPDDRESRVMAHAKNSLGPMGHSIRYHIDDSEGVVYDGLCDLDEDTIVQPRKDGTRQKSSVALEEAKSFLFEQMGTAGYADLAYLKQAAGELGIGQRTLYNARNAVQLQAVSIGFGADKKTWWLDASSIDPEQFKKGRQAEQDFAELL